MSATAADPAVRHRRRARASAVAGATAATLAVWAVAGPLAGIDLAARQGATIDRVGPVRVAVTTLLVGAAGWALLAILDRWTPHARGAWIAVAVAVLLLSLAGPLTAGVTVAAKLALLCLHVACAVVLIPLLARTS